MTRAEAIAGIEDYFDKGDFFAELARRVAIPTVSQEPERRPELTRYLTEEMQPSLEALGFDCRIFENPDPRGGPFLVARRDEDPALPTVLSYGHGDVVRGYEEQWIEGTDPWEMRKVGDRWYGRGTADNKGQHTINIAALAKVLATRGRLGFNAVLLLETGEETSSPGLREFCAAQKDLLKSDVFIASDGPRLGPDRPTVFMGSRGAFNFELRVELREGAHHSGNWGGALASPGILLSHAIASIVGPKGEILVPEWRPPAIPNSVRAAVAKLEIDGGADGPKVDPDWGEPGLTTSERLYAWNSFEVLAFKTGNPDNPVNAIPPRAEATCHIRYVVPCRFEDFLPALRRHLDAKGFEKVEIVPPKGVMPATRLDPDHPWARWAIDSIAATSGKEVAVLPNLGGTIPNDAFSEILGLPTIWVPHSYAACSQHAPNEHILEGTSREALQIMTGLFWDLGAGDTPAAAD